MTHKDPYQILGVSKTATADEIKSAYRRLAKLYHPDRNKGDKSAEAKFKEVQAAYEVLGDAERRSQYDRFGAGGPRPEYAQWGRSGQHPGGVHVEFDDIADLGDIGDLSSIFEQFFTRGGGVGGATRTRSRRSAARSAPVEVGGDIEHAVEVSFEESLRGTTREIVLSGDGHRERIDVRIPAGVEDGQKIRVRGRGHPGPGGRGDLILTVQVRPHAFWRREGLDLLIDVPLSFAEAALGAKVEIPTPTGPTVVTIPPGTSSHTRLRLRGKGIADARSGRTGDLYAVIRIETPRELSGRARQLIEDFGREVHQQPRCATGWGT
jgi:DnaJ-class molecular chaperone